ncbi:MAG: DUF2849 domain-containing protein [Myxococcota bacterium]
MGAGVVKRSARSGDPWGGDCGFLRTQGPSTTFRRPRPTAPKLLKSKPFSFSRAGPPGPLRSRVRRRSDGRRALEDTRIRKQAMAQIVIASHLGSGRVMFLARGSSEGSVSWGGLIETSEVAADEERAAALLALAEADANARHEVVDPYLIDVEEEEDGRLRPTKWREAIRCLGPTIRKDLGKQAEGAEA